MITSGNQLPAICTDVVCSPVSDGAVLLCTRTEVYYGLNSVGVRVWELLSEVGTLDELVSQLCEEYPQVAGDEIRSDVEALILDLEAAQLLESSVAEYNLV